MLAKQYHVPFKYAFWMDCSILYGVPKDQGQRSDKSELRTCQSNLAQRALVAYILEVG